MSPSIHLVDRPPGAAGARAASGYGEAMTADPGAPAQPALADLDWPVRTERLVLRPARSEDAAGIWPWHRDPDVQRWTTTLSLTPEAHQQWWDERLDTTVVAEFDGTIVATGMIRRDDAWGQADVAEQARGTVAEIGWVLDPAHQGQGLGTELAAALRDLAFDGLGVRRVVTECFAANLASRRVMEKIGLRHEATHRQDSLHRSGEWMDGMSYAQLAGEHEGTLLPATEG